MSALDREIQVMRGFASCRGDEDRINEAEEELSSLRAELDEWEKLRDPAVLHASLCRGLPAQLDRDALLHLAGVEQLCAELAASREREARMRKLLQAADVLFAHHCRDCTAQNWLDDTRAALAEGAQG